MDSSIIIRDETEADMTAITDVTASAFNTLELSSHTEQFIINALRKAGVLSLSLVAVHDGQVIGHIAFSPVTLSDGSPGWFGLGPVSVLPAFQRQGIGKALIREGLSRLRAQGASGCCLVGHPSYYGQFGFVNPDKLNVDGVPPEAFFALAFSGSLPEGTVTFHDSFLATGDD